MDSLAMFFGAKKAKKAKKVVKKSPVRKVKKSSPSRAVKSVGVVVIRNRERVVYKGKRGGLFYRSKGEKKYVEKSAVHRRKSSPKRASKAKRSPKRASKARKSPKRAKRVMRWGYGLGQPSLIDMMGPA